MVDLAAGQPCQIGCRISELAGRLVDGGLEGDVAPSTLAAFQQNDFLVFFKKLMENFTSFTMLHDGAKRHLEQAIPSPLAMLVTAATRLTVLGFPLRIEVESSQVTHVHICHHEDIAALAAIAAIGAALGYIFFPQETDAAVTSLTRLEVYLCLVEEHDNPVAWP